MLDGEQFQFLYGPTATFDGFTISPDDALIKYTYYGDTDFNGMVNFDDYAHLDQGFNNQLAGWINGDSDFSGAIDFDDYALIDLAFNKQNGTLRRAMTYLAGGDRSENGMDASALGMVQDHFQRFGNAYANSFLNAIPEPNTALVAISGLAASARRRRRN